MANLKKRITIYTVNNQVLDQYEGDIKIFWEDKKQFNCLHFVTEDGTHHRWYGDAVIYVEELN